MIVVESAEPIACSKQGLRTRERSIPQPRLAALAQARSVGEGNSDEDIVESVTVGVSSPAHRPAGVGSRHWVDEDGIGIREAAGAADRSQHQSDLALAVVCIGTDEHIVVAVAVCVSGAVHRPAGEAALCTAQQCAIGIVCGQGSGPLTGVDEHRTRVGFSGVAAPGPHAKVWQSVSGDVTQAGHAAAMVVLLTSTGDLRDRL